MAVGDPYVSLADLKSYMKVTVDGDDGELVDALASVSTEIERHCGRQFNRDAAASARLIAPDFPAWTHLPDFHTTTDLVVEVDARGDGVFTAWDADAFQLEPLDGVVDDQPDWPYSKIRAMGGRRLPVSRYGRATLRVTAQWGWAAVPEPVQQACKILAAETYTLRTAPLGVAGLDEYGVVRVRDSRIAAGKLARYCKRRILGG